MGDRYQLEHECGCVWRENGDEHGHSMRQTAVADGGSRSRSTGRSNSSFQSHFFWLRSTTAVVGRQAGRQADDTALNLKIKIQVII